MSDTMADGSPRSGLSQAQVTEFLQERLDALVEVKRLRQLLDEEHIVITLRLDGRVVDVRTVELGKRVAAITIPLHDGREWHSLRLEFADEKPAVH